MKLNKKEIAIDYKDKGTDKTEKKYMANGKCDCGQCFCLQVKKTKGSGELKCSCGEFIEVDY